MSFNGVVPAESCLSKIPPLQNPVFIADLHLAADKPATKEAFFKFLKNDAARFSELVILGDLFEFWAGDDHAPAYADILEALKAFFLNGHRIYVMHGNRDFCSVKVLPQPPVLSSLQTRFRFKSDLIISFCPTAICGARLILNISSSVRPAQPDVQRQILGEKLEHQYRFGRRPAQSERPMTTKKKARKSWMSSSMTSPVPCDNIESKSLFTDITHRPGTPYARQ